MYTSAPQSVKYKLIDKLQNYNAFVFYLIILFSIISLIMGKFPCLNSEVLIVKNFIYVLLYIMYGIITIVVDYILYPEAQEVTRNDFLDNSLGTKFIEINSSSKYYSNDELNEGFYRLAVNFFESCYFTVNISNKMKFKKLVVTLVLLLCFFPLIYIGIKETYQLVIIALQSLLSVYFFSGLLKLMLFSKRNNEIFESLKQLFQVENLKGNMNSYTGLLLKLYLDYESNKAWSYIHLSSEIYEKMNIQLSEEWNQIKTKYSIS